MGAFQQVQCLACGLLRQCANGDGGSVSVFLGGLLFKRRELDLYPLEFRLDTQQSLLQKLFLSFLGRTFSPAKRIPSARQLLQAHIETTCAKIIGQPAARILRSQGLPLSTPDGQPAYSATLAEDDRSGF